jgi:hypothetical protein
MRHLAFFRFRALTELSEELTFCAQKKRGTRNWCVPPWKRDIVSAPAKFLLGEAPEYRLAMTAAPTAAMRSTTAAV